MVGQGCRPHVTPPSRGVGVQQRCARPLELSNAELELKHLSLTLPSGPQLLLNLQGPSHRDRTPWRAHTPDLGALLAHVGDLRLLGLWRWWEHPHGRGRPGRPCLSLVPSKPGPRCPRDPSGLPSHWAVSLRRPHVSHPSPPAFDATSALTL